MAQLSRPAHRSANTTIRLVSTGPVNPQLDPLGVPFNIHNDTIYHLAENHFAVFVSRRRRLPKSRKIRGQHLNLATLRGRKPRWLFLLESLVVLFNLLHDAEFLFPRLFECTGDKPILRLRRVELPAGPFGFIRCSFESASPLRIEFSRAGCPCPPQLAGLRPRLPV